MVAIYGGINPKGLVLRETFNIRNSTLPRTTVAPIINASIAAENSTEFLEFNSSQSSTVASTEATNLTFQFPASITTQGMEMEFTVKYSTAVPIASTVSTNSKPIDSANTVPSPRTFALKTVSSVRHGRHRSTQMYKRYREFSSTYSTNAL